MNNAALSEPFPSTLVPFDLRSIAPIDPLPARERHLDAMTRGLASEFPLHSRSELQRAITAAEGDLWPRKDPIDVVDRARERLRDGLPS